MKNVRLIITDECQYRCFYCPYKAGMSRPGRLSEDTLLKILKTMGEAGAENVEIAGGEPLLYGGLPGLVEKLKQICGMKKVTVTTNGILLSGCISELKAAGIDGINIHIDTMASDAFTATTGREQLLNEVLKGIWAAAASDLPVAVTVGMHEYSSDQFGVMAGLAKQLPVTVRFVQVEEGTAEKYREKVQHLLPSDLTGWKGSVTFGCGIAGAFGMEDAVEIGGCLYAV